MKFVCERCHTRYSIADDKVRQKILKIRCKTCENVITVRDPGAAATAPAVSPSQPPPPPPRGATPPPVVREWFVAVNGTQAGPSSKAEAARHVADAHADDEIYVWKEGLDGWKAPHEVPAIQQEINALRPRTGPASHAPRPPVAPPRAPTPAPRAAAGRGSPATASLADAFGDEDHTQIQPFDAGMLGPELMGKPAAAPAAVLPFKSKPRNGAAPSTASAADAVPVGAGANLDGLFTDLPPEAGGAPMAYHAPAPAAAPHADADLSKLSGFAGFMSRNPGLKFVAAGTVVIVLLALAIIVLVRMPADQKPPPAPVAQPENIEPAPPPVAVEVPRPTDEKPAVKTASVGSRGPTIGASRLSKGKTGKTGRPAVSPPAQGGLEPAPIADPTAASGPPKVAADERRVPAYHSSRSSGAESAAGGGPTEGQIHAVVNRRENQMAIKTCYERALKRDDRIRSGRIEATVGIGMSGIVKSVALAAPAEFSNVEPCIKQAVRRWAFPANSEEYSTQFTLIMQGNL
jgi:predicted Zn finger-like uncharacterized protein